MYSDSYLRDQTIGKLTLGLATRLNYKKFRLEPRFNIGSSGIGKHTAEFYHRNNELEVYEIYSYKYDYAKLTSLNGELMLTFNFFNHDDFQVCIYFHSVLSYQKPKINYTLDYSNKELNYKESTFHTYNKSIMYFYNGFGILLRQ